jgi:hypothetical protein
MSQHHSKADVESSRALGWASIGIGLTELAAPRQLEHLMGIGNGENTGILRVCGVREVLSGIDILSHDDPAPGLWGRVAGDALDLALLGVAAKKSRRPGGLATACAMVVGIAALDMLVAMRLKN